MLLAEFNLSQSVSSIIDILKSAWGFISDNPLLIAIVAAPFVIGIIGALTSLFRRG